MSVILCTGKQFLDQIWGFGPFLSASMARLLG